MFNVGEKVRCKIIGIDDSRISLSIKALKEDPWKNVYKKYQVGQVVKGEITKINPFGAFVQLDKDIHGLVHVSKLSEEDKARLEVGKTFDFKIISIEPSDHRLGLKPYHGSGEKGKQQAKAEEVTKADSSQSASEKTK